MAKNRGGSPMSTILCLPMSWSSRRLRQSFQAVITAVVLAVMSTGSFAQNAESDDLEFDWAPNFPIGAGIPELSSLDQNGQEQNFDSLKGERGLLFLLSRSFDW